MIQGTSKVSGLTIKQYPRAATNDQRWYIYSSGERQGIAFTNEDEALAWLARLESLTFRLVAQYEVHYSGTRGNHGRARIYSDVPELPKIASIDSPLSCYVGCDDEYIVDAIEYAERAIAANKNSERATMITVHDVARYAVTSDASIPKPKGVKSDYVTHYYMLIALENAPDWWYQEANASYRYRFLAKASSIYRARVALAESMRAFAVAVSRALDGTASEEQSEQLSKVYATGLAALAK